MSKELLIGFDVRTIAGNTEILDDQKSRNMYILNDRAERVYTADPLIWSSFFTYEQLGSPELGRNCHLWSNKQRLLEASIGANREDYCLIAATVYDEPDKETQDRFDILNLALLFGAELLGYDIADSCMLSGLSNCSYWEDEMAKYRPSISPQLNSYNLFTASSDALAFIPATTDREPEQAPFFCVGLYKLPW